MKLNKVMFVGNLVADPELRQTQTGKAMCRFKIAVPRQRKEDPADFFECTAFDKNAEFIAKWFCKGKSIYVEGEIHNNNYTLQDGTKHYGISVSVMKADFGIEQKPSTNTPAAQGVTPTATARDTANNNVNDFEDVIGDTDTPF